MVAYNYPYSSPSPADVSDSLGTALADPNTVFAKTGAKKKRSAPDMLALIMTPEDCGAYGDDASHTMQSIYGSGPGALAAAQVDYPAAISLTDEADGCAWKYLIESSGAKEIRAFGRYIVPNNDLAHVIKGQSDQRIIFGRNSKWTANTWGNPSIAWCEKANVLVEGLNWYCTGVFTSTAVNNGPWTPAQFNSIVGPVWTTSQSYRNITGALSINGTDNITIQHCSFQHATPGRNNNVFMGISLSMHVDGRPSDRVRILDSVIDDCHFGIFGYARNLELRRLVRNRYDQVAIDAWAGGHFMYLSSFNPNGSGNSQVTVEDCIDYGFYAGTDSAAIVVDTSADTVTFDYGAEAVPSNMAVDAGVAFVNDLPPAPLILDRIYFVKTYNSSTKAITLCEVKGGAQIDLTAQPGANCRMVVESGIHAMAPRYCNGLTIRNLRSYCPHGTLICHNTRNVRAQGVSHFGEILRGTLVSGSAQGGVFDSGVPVGSGYAVDRAIRIVSGLGAGQKRRVIAQTGGSGGIGPANSFVVDTPWATVPNGTSVYEVGHQYIGGAAVFYGTATFSSNTYDDFWLRDSSIFGEFNDKTPFYFQAYSPTTPPQGRRMFFHDIDIDMDISRITTGGPISFGGADCEFRGKVRHRGVWPAGEKGLVTLQAGTTGAIDITLMDPALYSRIVFPANCDVDVRLRTKNGKPIPFTGQWANEATTAGIRLRSEPVEAMFVSGTGGTGTPTITIANFGRLAYNGCYRISALVHDSGWTQVCLVEWIVNYAASGTPTVTKMSTTQLVGTTITTADITQASGVLSATVTTASSVTVTIAWTWKLLLAH
jgi:hypothetical protein